MGLKSGSKSGKGVKQSSTKLSLSKSTSQNPGKTVDSDDEPDIDTSVMRPSIEISVSGIPQLVRAYQAATEELKSILARECDIIYECRVCRNLFRSLANMMAHKRVYCKTTYSYTKHTLNRNHMVEDYTVVIQPEPVPSNTQDKQNWTTSDKVPDCSNENEKEKSQIVASTSRITSYTNPKKGLREIVDRLAKNTCDSNTSSRETKYSSTTELYDNINASILARKNDQIEHSYQLEDIETTKVGMFQTKLVSSSVGAEKDDLMKAQVSELQHMALQNEAVLGPDGQTIILNRQSPLSVQKNVLEKTYETNEPKSVKDEHVCPDCNVKFSTRKTLNHHMKSLHVTFRLCYPCPCCKSTFVNPWSVYRHLYKVHRKTAAQVRRMRPQIQKKVFKKEIHNEIPVTQNSVKNDALKELQRLDQENQAWMDNFEEDLELQRCGGCGRRFERRAALNSHSQICQKRIAARNNVKTMRNLPNISSDKITKIHHADDHTLGEANKKSNSSNKSVDPVNSVLNTVASSRICQSGSWVEQSKKEVREKKIEIQIRKDYCKMSSASSVVALSNDTQSEPDSRPPSRIVDDEECYEEVRDWESMVEMEEENKEDSDSEYPLFRDAQDPATLEDDKDSEESVCRNSPVSESDVELSSSVKDTVSQRYDNRKDEFCVFERKESALKRRVSDESICFPENEDNEAIKRRRQSFEAESSNVVDDTNNALVSKNTKLEQLHPVMEARMKKFINLRRLQCLPCQKKFIKLTNLRRHVAVHIGWCRYKCMLCPFKCFSKYDCVDHVCKIHLNEVNDKKVQQRSKAAAMVEYIEEQESEATVDTVQSEELNDYSDHVSNCEEALEPLAVEINSLNLEDIRNIVGVSDYPADRVNKSGISGETKINVTNSEHLLQHSSQNDSPPSVNNEKTVVDFEVVDVDIQNLKKKEEKLSCNENKGTSPTHSEKLVDEHKSKEILPTETPSSCDYFGGTGPVHSTEMLCKDIDEEKKIEIGSNAEGESAVETQVTETANEDTSKNDNEKDEPNCITDIPTDEPEIKEPQSSSASIQKEEMESLSPYLIYDEQKSEASELEIEDTSNESITLLEEMNDRKSESTECYAQLQSSDVEILEEEIVKDVQVISSEPEPQAESTVERESSSPSPCINGEYAESPKSLEEKVLSENEDYSGSPPTAEDDQNALRKMVMEVIFGSGGNSGSPADPNQNLISVSMNGNIFDEDSSDGRYSRASSASDPDVIIINNHLSPTSKDLKQSVDLEHGRGLESERRERPVRNRVKVEKEDFIYDFTDSFLKKEESLKAGSSSSSSSSGCNRKKQTDAGKETVKYDITSSHSSGVYKSVPKLMLVRTDTGESTGNRRLTGPIKGSWSSVYAAASDCASNKNYVASSSQMCNSPRKVPRTYDVKP